jgi:SAM-dependent methyltransferase
MSPDSVSRDDRAHWEARYAERGPEHDRTPSPWVLRHCLALPPAAIIVDVAGGSGRHAIPLARAGRTVVVIDFIVNALEAARSRHRGILAAAADVRTLPLAAESVDALVCVSFLDRTVFASFANALRPGGVLIYETFTQRHLELVAAGRARGPRNPAFLLEPEELRTLVAPLVVREYAEGLVDDAAGVRHVAQIVAVKS